MNSKNLLLGFLGDGQLALMLGEAAHAQGIEFLAFGEDAESPFAAKFPERHVLGKPDNANELNDFARRCTVLTLENEFFSSAILRKLEKTSGTRVIPSPDDYAHFENKVAQRRFYDSLGLSGPKWSVLNAESVAVLKVPTVLKASQGGYDGYGVRIVEQKQQLEKAMNDLGFAQGREILQEEKVSLKREFAQGAVFDGKGNATLLPLVETVQKNGICEMVLSRSTLPSSELEQITQTIRGMMMKISTTKLQGLFNFEFFVTETGEVLINEGAPRPHNSQHLTLNASATSQFDLLVKFLATGEVEPGEIQAEPAVMVNLLGKSKGTEYVLKLPKLPDSVKIFPKLYLKKECRPGRKMGHLNLVDSTGREDLGLLASKILKEYEL